LSASLDDYRWLLSEAALPWLELASGAAASSGHGSRSEPRSGNVSTQLLSRLRKDLSAARAHLVVEQLELRQRAREKFALADRMFFTRKGLEQATDEHLAEYKVMCFPAGERCADLCCGIGGDFVALARRGATIGVDLDPVAALLAEANVAAHAARREQCSVCVQEAAEIDVTEFAAWHCDPDRRAEGKRTTRVESFAPSLDVLNQLLASNPNAAVKLAPATEAPAAWADAAELEWLGSRGKCRQQVAWFGGLARNPGQRTATIVVDTHVPRTVVGIASDSLPVASSLGRYVYEPQAAVLAAKLTGTLCHEHELKAVSTGIAYLTSDQLIADAALASFEVVDVMSLDRKQLKAYCRQHQIGRLEVKKRGIDVDPARLRKEIISRGDNEATLIVTPVTGQTRAIIALRLP
jgi:THUMP domain-like